MIVGDGMGPAYTSAYRYFNDNPDTPMIEETVFDRHLVGLSSTYPARVSGYVTDSAAGATALATGVKSYNGAIAVDVNKESVETVLERAKTLGKKTGVVVTSQINHATPASYLAHNEKRSNYNAIADDYIDEGIKADLYLGGGWKYFIREDRNLVDEFKDSGFHYIDSYEGLATIPADKPVLGLFGNSGLPWALDDTNEHRLSLMTKAAVKQLENEQGFFMLVEASQVDWGGHNNDIAAAMGEMEDLALTLEFLESYVAEHPDTLVVLTADHSTGGFTIAANGKYEWKPDVLRTMTMSPRAISESLAKNPITADAANTMLNFTLTDEELAKLVKTKEDTLASVSDYETMSKAEQKDVKKPYVKDALKVTLKKIIDVRTNTGWTSSGHTGIDVPVFAFGANSEDFAGKIDNTDIAKNIFKLLGK